MIKAALMWMVLAAASLMSTSAQAGVICTFGGTGTSGTDCLGHSWVVGNGGWGIPGIGNSVVSYLGTTTASDFHFRCLAGCGAIQNSSADDTRFSLSPFGTTFWNETVNVAGDTIDFTSPSVAADLTPGRGFFVNITVAITTTNFRFEAWWTDRSVVVPEPSSLALIGAAALALGVARRRQVARVV